VGRRTFKHYWELDGVRPLESLNLEYPFFESGQVSGRVPDFDEVWLVLSYSMPREKKQRARPGPTVTGYRQYLMTFYNGLAVARYVREPE